MTIYLLSWDFEISTVVAHEVAIAVSHLFFQRKPSATYMHPRIKFHAYSDI
jgi:hypothetical protein